MALPSIVKDLCKAA